MSFLAINGVALPPCKRGVKPLVTTIVNAGRNVDAQVVGQRVGRDQYKIDTLEFPYLTAAQWSQILRLMAGFFFFVTFPDPVSNSKRTIKMYCGDRSGEPYWVDANGNPTHYIDCKVNLVDTGE